MKLALIGDVHANLPALEVVLDHARQQEVEAIWNIGDFVGYGAFPDEVVKRLIKEKAISIIGNYDLKVLKYPKKKKKWRKSKMPQKWFAFKWAYENLSKKSRKYLLSLPEEIRLIEGGKHILLTHGSPASNEEHLTPDTPEQRLRELARMTASENIPKADVIICGHSHREFVRQVEATWFINTGSVGRPDDGDPRACYATLQLDHQGMRAKHYRLKYDVDRAVVAIREKGLPEVFAQMLIQGRDLETVLDNLDSTPTTHQA
ncbi:MAG TPA: metallophosphoesterase family protein [Anaerolineales bacterium]|nr:metallophosphoesterase family protein [Anaerolineales bacterium]